MRYFNRCAINLLSIAAVYVGIFAGESVCYRVLWRLLYDSLCHDNSGLEEGSNTLEPFALDLGLVCMSFLYDWRWKSRDSKSVEALSKQPFYRTSEKGP